MSVTAEPTVFAWLNNSWTIGIGGGIVSGIIVTGVTNWLIGAKQKKEYRGRVQAADQEIMATIRPSVAEKTFPPFSVIESLMRSTANKYAVRYADLMGVNAICNNIIKEIMDNVFLSVQQKKNFCELVTNLRNRESLEHKSRHPHDSTHAPKREVSHAAGLTMGFAAAAISLFLSLRPELTTMIAGISEQGRLPSWLGIIGVTLMIPLLHFLVFTRSHARRKKEAALENLAKLQQEKQDAHKAVTKTMRKIRRAEIRKTP